MLLGVYPGATLAMVVNINTAVQIVKEIKKAVHFCTAFEQFQSTFRPSYRIEMILDFALEKLFLNILQPLESSSSQ